MATMMSIDVKKPAPSRRNRGLTVTSINAPDPAMAAAAIVPLLFDWMKREREKAKKEATGPNN